VRRELLHRGFEVGARHDAVHHPHLERLRQATNETVSLYIRLGDRRVCIEELESGQDIKYSQTAGLAAPLYVGAPGKALLAYLPPAELEALLATLPLVAITPNTLTDREQLLEELTTVRQRGYAVSIGERSLWASAAAAPIRDWSGKPIAAISVLGPSHRLTSEGLPALGEQVKQVAVEISIAFGFSLYLFSQSATLRTSEQDILRTADRMLDRMERHGYDPLRPFEFPQWRRQWLLWRAARRPQRMFG
jgi:DNA-binding IclR family transcriptional regulator